MDYTVRTTQNAAGLWNWSIYKGDLLAEADTSKGYTTEIEAREVSGPFLADHTAGLMSAPEPDKGSRGVKYHTRTGRQSLR